MKSALAQVEIEQDAIRVGGERIPLAAVRGARAADLGTLWPALVVRAVLLLVWLGAWALGLGSGWLAVCVGVLAAVAGVGVGFARRRSVDLVLDCDDRLVPIRAADADAAVALIGRINRAVNRLRPQAPVVAPQLLDTEDKRRSVGQLKRIDQRWNWLIPAFFVVLGVSSWVAITVPAWPVRGAAVVLSGVVFHTLANFMHEAAHGSLFRNKRLSRWVGFLAGLPVLVPVSAFRVVHLTHHRHTRGPTDPDELSNLTRSQPGYVAWFFAWLAIGGLIYNLDRVPMSAFQLARSKQERRAIALEYALLWGIWLGVVACCLALDRIDVILWGWAGPAVVATALVNLRVPAEHMMTERGNALLVSRTFPSNRLLSLFAINLNYHAEHHLFPGMPWYNLPKVHALLREDLVSRGTPIRGSYLVHLWRAVRTLGLGPV